MESEGVLEEKVRECLAAPDVEFPPPLRTPKSEEFLQVRDRGRKGGRKWLACCTDFLPCRATCFTLRILCLPLCTVHVNLHVPYLLS